MTIELRPAVQEDLQDMVRVWMLSEGDTPGPNLVVPTGLLHMMQTGLVRVAEVDRVMVGFAVSFLRDNVTFLAQLFISPEQQSGGIGQALLKAVMPDDGSIRATVSSPDPRAVSLYVRHRMAPVWPAFDLRAGVQDLRFLPEPLVEVQSATPGDPDLEQADLAAGGRLRREDHRHWIQDRGGVPLWFERGARRVGYAYLQVGRDGSDANLRGDSVRIGPVGAEDARLSFDCVLAAVFHARELGSTLEILVPGPHPVLGAMLESGFRIKDIETFMTSANPPFVDGSLYIPSGGGLF